MFVLSVPAIFALELTPVCNSRCVGCSNVYSDDRSPAPLSADEWRAILSGIGPEAVQIRLTGGEPTLHPGFFEILTAATAFDAQVTVFTNARWPHPARLVERLQDWPHLNGLLVSLHGADAAAHEAFTRTPGSFDQAVGNIRLAVQHGITITLSTIITRHNWHDLPAVLDLARSLGVGRVAFNRYLGAPLPEIEADRDQLQAAVQSIEAMAASGADVIHGICIPPCFAPNSSQGCLAGVGYVSIDPWGRMRPCAHSTTVIGSVRETPVPALWQSEAFNRWRALMPEACLSCAAYAHCHGGCRAIQELRADGRDPLRGDALAEYVTPSQVYHLPAAGCPSVQGRLRAESFGYSLLGRGQAIPLRQEARAVIEACDGRTTFARLAEWFGEPGITLLGELWGLGLVEIV